MKIVVAVFFSILISFQISFAQEIKLSFPDFSPWTYEEKGTFAGIGVEKVSLILNAMGVKYSFHPAPNYGKTLRELKVGKVDGFFLASENNERNQVALFSKPVAVNQWSWFFPKDSRLDPKSDVFKNTITVGTHLNANTHKWLLKKGYKAGPVYNKEVLPSMLLKSRRIDAVFLSSQVFHHDAAPAFTKNDYKEIVESKRNFGIYISKKYLKRYPDFMLLLNAEIEKLNDNLKPE